MKNIFTFSHTQKNDIKCIFDVRKYWAKQISKYKLENSKNNYYEDIIKSLSKKIYAVKDPYYFKVIIGYIPRLIIPYPSNKYHMCGFKTYNEAKKAFDTFSWENKYALVTINSDPTEGKGRQIFDAIFSEAEDAYNYIVQETETKYKDLLSHITGSVNSITKPIEFSLNADSNLIYHSSFGLYNLKLIEIDNPNIEPIDL